jgi:SNF2 family DNA or RNA helicase
MRIPRQTKASHTPKELMKFEIVLATYEKLPLESKAFENTTDDFVARQESNEYYLDPVRSKSSLPVLDWHVIVLEEGHRIANSSSLTAKAAYSLSATYRLPLTGTMFQNEYSDCQSAMRFLQVKPWDDAETFRQVSLLIRKTPTKDQN